MEQVRYEPGSRWFLGHLPVIIEHHYADFQLVRIHLEDTKNGFCADEHALAAKPDYTTTISLALFSGTV